MFCFSLSVQLKSIHLLWRSHFIFEKRTEINSIFTLCWEQTYIYVSLILKTTIRSESSICISENFWTGSQQLEVYYLSICYLPAQGRNSNVCSNYCESGTVSTDFKNLIWLFALVEVGKIRSASCPKQKNSFGVLKKINN